MQDAQARGMQIGECLALWGSVEAPGGAARQRGLGRWGGGLEGGSRRTGERYMCAASPVATVL